MSHASGRTAELTAQEKRTLLAQLLQQKAQPTTFPLSHGQQALWFIYQLAPESWTYHVVFSVRIRSEVDVAALQRAFQALSERHPALRTTYSAHHGTPAQSVQPQVQAAFAALDVPGWSQEALYQRLLTEARQPFDLEHGPVMRVRLLTCSAREHVLVWVVHHIAIDMWSLGVLLDELRMLYPAEKMGVPASLPVLERQYLDYVRQQVNRLAGPEGERLWAFWQHQLAGATPALALPTDRPRPPVQTYVGATHAFALSAQLTQQLKALAQSENVTLYMTLLAAFYVLLYRYTGQEDILVGTPTANRMQPEYRRVVGYFVNPVVLRTHVVGHASFRDLLRQTRDTVQKALAHQHYPFSLLLERLQAPRDASRSPLFQVMFVLQQLHGREDLMSCFVPGTRGAELDFAGLVLEPLALPQEEGQFDLTLEMAEVGESLLGGIKYNTDLFDAATISRMVGHLQRLLTGIVTHVDQHVATLPLLTAAESQQVLGMWSGSHVRQPHSPCLHQLFEAQVARTPDAIAVVFDTRQLTYRELNCSANRLAHYLRTLGVGPEVRVGICMERSLELVIGLLGILKTGGAYVPLEPAYPQERLAFMLEDAQVPVLLTQERLLAGLPDHHAQTLCLDTDWEMLAPQNEENPSSGVVAENVAYVIYTSGSTGRPKGAMNSHRSICNRLLWMQDAYQLSEADRVLQKTPCSFDVSVWEFFWPLMTGACLVVAPPEAHKDSAYLVKLIASQQITTLHFVPSMLQVFLEEQGLATCSCLRHVMCSGEALPFALQELFFVRLDAALHNLYGPTEAAIDVTFWACKPGSHQPRVPIGRPIANTHIPILDAHLQPVPIGVPGELHIGGIGLARGYLNRPELSAEKFIPDPFSSTPGARLYKTGDLARYLPGGTIEYLGRIDHQVKIRGFRIEIGEIEAVLGQHPALREVVILAREDGSGGQRLAAYFVPAQKPAPTFRELYSFLKRKLPNYMLPSTFVMLDALPLTPNGKVDRRALLASEQTQLDLDTAFVAPRTPRETMLAEVWCQVLGRQQVGIHDNFFELGGHSLQAIQLVAKISTAMHLDISIRSLFLHPTIAALAAALGDLAAASEPSAPPSSRFTTSAHRPLLAPFAAGDIAPVEAAALAYLPISLLERTGLSRDEILHAWCDHRPFLFSVLETFLGRIAVVVLPWFSSELYSDQEALLEVICDALDSVARLGARTVSLTGLLPSATDYGRAIVAATADRHDLPLISTGHAATTTAVVLAIRRLMQEGGRDLAQECVGFLGLGSIGLASLHLMLRCLPHPREIMLCDVYSKLELLQAVRQEIIQDLGFQGAVRIVESQTGISPAFYEATLIIGATNVPDILDIARVQPGTLIVDDSAPHCFRPASAVQRFREQEDILFTEGGVLCLPHPIRELRYVPPSVEQVLPMAQLEEVLPTPHPFHIMGCVFSSLLPSCFQDLKPTLGLVDGHTCLQHYEVLNQLGLQAAALHCEGYLLAEESMRNFRQRFGKSRQN
jgi:amino acid adenylation domain-containing protein